MPERRAPSTSPSTKVTFGGRRARPRASSSSSGTSVDRRRPRVRAAPARRPARPAPAAGVERSLVAARRHEAASLARELVGALAPASCREQRQRVTLRSGHDPASRRASSSASSRVVIVPAARSSSITSSSPPTSGPGGSPSSSPRTSGSSGSLAARASTASPSSSRAEERERLERPGLGRAAEAVDRARRVVRGRLGPRAACARTAAARSRSAGARASVAEDRDEPELGRVVAPAVAELVERAAERREQPELVEPPEAAPRQPLELGEDPLAGRLVDERGVRRGRAPRSSGVEPEVELVLEPDGPQQPQRVVLEDASSPTARRRLRRRGRRRRRTGRPRRRRRAAPRLR